MQTKSALVLPTLMRALAGSRTLPVVKVQKMCGGPKRCVYATAMLNSSTNVFLINRSPGNVFLK
jgi:hypothetical protein